MDWELWASTLAAAFIGVILDRTLLAPRPKLRLLHAAAQDWKPAVMGLGFALLVENQGTRIGYIPVPLKGTFAPRNGAAFDVTVNMAAEWEGQHVQHVVPDVGAIPFQCFAYKADDFGHQWTPGTLVVHVPLRRRAALRRARVARAVIECNPKPL